MAPHTDWAVEMGKNGNMPSTTKDFTEMIKQMDKLGLKGIYNPKNVYPGSPFTPSSFPTAPEVQQRARSGSEKVLHDWNLLRRIVERHSDVLEKRWAKKTRKKQKEILLQAWPNMAATHRPDYEAYRQENTGVHFRGLSRFQNAYKWPYINQQDLSSRSLVVFINSRGRNPPSVFARADLDATRLGTVGHFIEEPAFLQGFTMFMDGETVDAYGRLVSWDEDPKAADLLFSQRQFAPGDGLRVFELQERIYPFLIKCCELILHDLVESGSLFNGQVSAVSEIPTTTKLLPVESPAPAAITEILPSLASISAEAPYRLPASLNLDRLRGILAARLSAAEDHLWELREDPGYFADTVLDWSEHRNDKLLDTNGNPHPTGPHTTEFWERVVRNVIGDAHSGYEGWSLLHRQVNRLIALKEKYENEISYEKQLPQEYLIAILKFKQLVEISCESPMHFLKNIQSSPALRHYFTRAPQQPGTINMYIKPINELDPHFHKPWGLLLILWDEQQRELFGISNVIDAFEQIMQDPTEKKNLSPYMSDWFADLSILTRALHEIEIYQPWAATFEDENKKNQREILKICEEATFQIRYIDHMDTVMSGITHLAMPHDRKFYYPVDKKRTKQTTDAMISAEQNLDLFWSRFDANWKRLAKRDIESCMGDHTPRQRGWKKQRTAPWVEPIKEAKPAAHQEQREPKPWTDSKEEKTPTKTKQKIKTKGADQATDTSSITTSTPTPQPDTQPTFKVDKTSLKVFSMLFFTPGQTAMPGEIPWIDFLRAMGSTGFAAQKLYGSIWQFTPAALDVERSIQFHEPHPAVKVRFAVARRMGRRSKRPKDPNAYMDIEYKKVGINIRRPHLDDLDESTKLAREVSRAARKHCNPPPRTKPSKYSPSPLATASEEAGPRGILKSGKDETSGNGPTKENNGSKAKARNVVKVEWKPRLTENIKPTRMRKIRRQQAKRADVLSWLSSDEDEQASFASNEGALHDFPASFGHAKGKGQSSYIYPFRNAAVSVPSRRPNDRREKYNDSERKRSRGATTEAESSRHMWKGGSGGKVSSRSEH
ncbi:hypothetical protein LSUE1_G004095 [Lachnellula suecica]|uniref:Uncharacterized protein n=1 Tax=Lachnellula suecica TaxID=602035 RepID=A0A8T9C833_9HELO|nr:hypothetical protein LSUE1_G004095 [Lachnellula suecica]